MTKTARVYGDSLYDLAREEELSDQLNEEMEEVLALFRQFPDYMKLLKEPSIAKKERLQLIDQAFGPQIHRYHLNFLKILCERGYMGEYAGCRERFLERYDSDHGIVRATAVSAAPLSDEQKEKLKARLEQISKKKVRLSVRTDPSLIAGLKVEMDGEMLDGSVSGRLDVLGRRLRYISV